MAGLGSQQHWGQLHDNINTWNQEEERRRSIEQKNRGGIGVMGYKRDNWRGGGIKGGYMGGFWGGIWGITGRVSVLVP